MADMRQIFTYPNNLATDYIDPDYVGNSSEGFTRRIDQLISGTYKTWLNPKVITATTSQVMQNLSKFGNYYENVSYAGHLSRYDFWQQPMVIATKQLITSLPLNPIGSGADVHVSPMLVTFATPHEFLDGMRLTTTGLDGAWGQYVTAGHFPEMYAKIISDTEIQVATDQNLTSLIEFVPGQQSFELDYGAWNYFNPLAGTTDYSNCRYLTVDFTSAVPQIKGTNDLQILDGQEITVNSYLPDPNTYQDPKIASRTYYLKNTSTSSVDNIFEVYNESSLTNRIEFVDDATAGSGVTLPLWDDGAKQSVTINQTNPATITFTNLLDPDAEHIIHVDSQYAVEWTNSSISSERYFGPINNNQNPVYWLIPTTDPYVFEFSTVPPTASNYPQKPNWAQQNAIGITSPDMEFSQLAQPQNSSTRPWAISDNARIKWLKGLDNGWSENYVDGTAANLFVNALSPGEFWNDPYYLKSLPEFETATYKVFDVYKDPSMNTLYGPADYQNGSQVTITAKANWPFLVFPASQGTNPPTTNYTLSQFEANANYPQWGISTGDNLTATWDPINSEWNVTSHYATDLKFGDPAEGSFTPDESVETPYYGTGADWSQGYFWAYQDIGTDASGGTSCVLDIARSDGTLQPGANITFTRDPNYRVSGGYTWYQWWGGTNKTGLAEDVEFRPTGTSGSKVYLDSAKTKRYWRIGTNGPTSLPSNNSGGYLTTATPSTSFLTESAAPADYNSIDNTGYYYLQPTGTTSGNETEYYVYSNYNNTGGAGVDKFDFDPSSKSETGITSAWDTSGTGTYGDYPVGVNVTVGPTPPTNFTFQYEGITGYTDLDWRDGQQITLYLTKPGQTTWTQAVYLKQPQGLLVWEFYTDSALTTPLLTTDFVTAYETINGGTTPHADTRLQIHAKESVRPTALGSATSPTFNPIYGDTTYTAASATGSNDTFNVNVYNLGATTIQTRISSVPGGTPIDTPDSATTFVSPATLQIGPDAQTGPYTGGEMLLPYTDSTVGNIGPHPSSEALPYEIGTVTLLLPGNQQYTYQNSSNVTTPGAVVNTSKYWDAGSSTPSYYTSGTTAPQFNVTVDGDGYLQNVTLVDDPSAPEGRYPTGEDIILLIESRADEYTPTPLTPAEQADIFNTHDEWGGNLASNLKTWPNHISPASANIVYNQPTIANMSQNGVKYTRSGGFTKWVLEVEYPPMKAKDFQKFHAMAQAMQGQSKSIYFKLRNADDVSILWADMMDTNSSLSGLNIPTSPVEGFTPQGFYVLHLEGLTASDPEAFREGEVFIAGENENGSLHTAIGAAASNVFGEAKVRMTYPLRSNLAQTAKVDKNPEWAIVTLNSDAFEYSVDVNNYYTVSVAFDLDQWGS